MGGRPVGGGGMTEAGLLNSQRGGGGGGGRGGGGGGACRPLPHPVVECRHRAVGPCLQGGGETVGLGMRVSGGCQRR